MAKLFRAEQMQAADQAAMQAGLASLLLMEAAARQITKHAYEAYNHHHCRRVLVLCGKGNNGGDGYAAARQLAAQGCQVRVLEHCRDPAELGSDSQVMRQACAVTVAIDALEVETLEAYLQPDTLLIDALLGSGLNRALAGSLLDIVRVLNASPLPILSVDVPTGIGADQGQPLGEAVRADITVQLAGAKLASALEPARSYFGEQCVVDIGIPEAILEAQADIRLVDADWAARALPKLAADAHKYSAGTVLVVAGSPRYAGAAELACRGALRSGAGLVTLAASTRQPTAWPEIIWQPLEWHADPVAALSSLDPKRAQALVIGPGLDADAAPYLVDIMQHFAVPTVLDAGALTGEDAWFDAINAHGHVVITPHIGEAARLLEVASSEVLADVVTAGKQLAERSGAITVLKGATTVISQRQHTAISTAGHPGMATGGSGDVLAGVIGAVLAGSSPGSSSPGSSSPGSSSPGSSRDDSQDGLFERVSAAVYWHGQAGEHAAATKGMGMLPQDLIDALATVRLRFVS
jgi:NAD(P)H-hydrate epimerase